MKCWWNSERSPVAADIHEPRPPPPGLGWGACLTPPRCGLGRENQSSGLGPRGRTGASSGDHSGRDDGSVWEELLRVCGRGLVQLPSCTAISRMTRGAANVARKHEILLLTGGFPFQERSGHLRNSHLSLFSLGWGEVGGTELFRAFQGQKPEAQTLTARPLRYELVRPQGQDREDPRPGLIPGLHA